MAALCWSKVLSVDRARRLEEASETSGCDRGLVEESMLYLTIYPLDPVLVSPQAFVIVLSLLNT